MAVVGVDDSSLLAATRLLVVKITGIKNKVQNSLEWLRVYVLVDQKNL